MDPSISPAPSPPTLLTQGDFASVAASDLLVELIRRRFTGTLRVERHGTVKVVYFSQGNLACASSNAEEDRLGNILVRSGRLTAEQLAHAKSKQSERASIGNTLVELGFITAAELLEGARRQVEEIITDLVGWREGTYQVREVALSKEIVNLSLPGSTLLVRALQQTSDREMVTDRLGSMEAVLARVEPFEEAARALDFGVSVEAVLGALDGQRSVRSVCEVAGEDDFQTCKVLYTLLAFGLVKRSAPAAARELIFVEGELQSGEEVPLAGERPSRRARRQAQESGAARASVPAVAPAAPEAAEPALAASSDGPAIAALPSEETLVPSPRPARLAARKLLWGGAVALGLGAILAGILYLTYFRPTVSAEDAEEARLLAALMEEARQQGADIAGPASPPARAGVAPAKPQPAAPPPAAARSLEAAPPAAKAAPPSPPPQARPPSSAPAAGTTGRALRPEPSAGLKPAAEPAPGEAAPLAKSRLAPMLSADGNFRTGLDLVHQHRFPEAAESFRKALDSQRSGACSIQLLLACQESTLEKAFERAPDRTLYFVATTFRGQSCYRLLEGLYASEEEARQGLEQIPAVFREDGNHPTVVRIPGR